MPVNADKREKWDEDIAKSVDTYNKWFLRYAPKAFRKARSEATKKIEEAMALTHGLRDITSVVLRGNPSLLSVLRMVTTPPLARDRVVGLAKVSKKLVNDMELRGRIPPKMSDSKSSVALERITQLIADLIDDTLIPWRDEDRDASEEELARASLVLADRLCGSITNPDIRNAQEARQIKALSEWLESRGYTKVETGSITSLTEMKPGTYAIRLVIEGEHNDGSKSTIPTDMVIKRKTSRLGDLPLLIEAKSAGDFTNVNKRRKEEAQKMEQLQRRHGADVPYILFLCGFFNRLFLDYEAKAGFDWVWEHRINDLILFDV